MNRNVLYICFGLTSFSALAESGGYPAVDCVIQPHKVVDLGTPVSGVIDRVLVERSEFVRTGQAVAQLEDHIERATVDLAKARTELDAQIQAETINLHYDGKAKDRIDSLYSRRVIPVESKDTADREAELSTHRVQQIRDLKTVRDLEFRRAQKLVDQKIIRSSIDGFVIEQFKSEGEYVEDQPILRIAQLDPLNIEAIIPMSYFGLIRPGMKAQVSPELPGLDLQQATVSLVDRIGDAASGTFGVRLEMDNPEFRIPAGLKCDVKFLETSEAEISVATDRRKAKQASPKVAGTVADVVADPVADSIADAEAPKKRAEMSVSDSTTSADFVLGPIESKAELRHVTHELRNETFAVREEAFTVGVDFIVLAKEDSSLTGRRLADAGFNDFFYYRQPPYARRFSLGVFPYKSRAERHAANATRQGFPSEVLELPKTKNRWWVDLSLLPERASEYSSLLRTYGQNEETLQLSGQPH